MLLSADAGALILVKRVHRSPPAAAARANQGESMKENRRRRLVLPAGRLRVLLTASFFIANSFSLLAEDDVCSAGYITAEVKGEQTIDQHGSRYQSVNVFSYEFNGDCRIVAKSPWVEEVSARLRNDPKRLILIDIVNEIELTPGPCRNMSPGEILHYFVSDPVRRAEHVRQVVAIGALGQGVEIDYENVLPQTKPYITQFMRELRAALPAEKKLAQVLQPKTNNGSGAGQNIDWRGVEPYVDYIRVMAYYYSWKTSPPGPVITYGKLDELSDYILNSPAQSIPTSKARIMLSLYGWDWQVSPLGEGQLIRYEEAMAIALAHNITPVRDPVQDTLHFQYATSTGVVHEVWFEDFVGQSKRVQLLLDKNFPAVDLWHLNTGDPRFWEWFTPKVRSDCASFGGTPPMPAEAVINNLSVSAVTVGSSSTTVAINGSRFKSSDVVLWGGTPYVPSASIPNSIQVTVLAADLQNPRAMQVAVAQDGRLSNVTSFYVVGNPVLEAFDPPTVPAGNQDFVLTVKGVGYEPASQVLWSGKPVPTNFINGQSLQANISAALISSPQSVSIGVINPTSGARISKRFVIEPTPAAPSAYFRVGPNPWRAGKHQGGIRFMGLVPGDEVKLYTFSGGFVRRLEAQGVLSEWDLTNEEGKGVASGEYSYLVTGTNGKKSGSLTVIR